MLMQKCFLVKITQYFERPNFAYPLLVSHWLKQMNGKVDLQEDHRVYDM